MTKTERYQLPQWEASDPVRRGDFNDAMGAIDAGIAKAQTTADMAAAAAAGCARSGILNVEANLMAGTEVLACEEGVKFVILWPLDGTPALLYPDGFYGRAYIEGWDAYMLFCLMGSSVMFSGQSNYAAAYTFHYTAFY